ncbi:MAG: S9 family peptidase [Thermomicrobiales bacterium]
MSPSPRRPITISDLSTLQMVGTPQISPDGSRIAYVLTTMHDTETENHYRSAIWLAHTDGSAAPRRLTFGPKRDTAPAWSPDGSRLAFVSDRAGKAQIHLLDFAAGGEARKLTDAPDGAGDPRWSPDGTQILYTARVRAEEPEKEQAPDGYKPPRVFTKLKHKADGDGYFDDRRRHLFVISAEGEGGEARQLTSGDWNASNPAWSPDGRWVAYCANQDEDRDTSEVNDLWVVPADADNGPARKVTSGRGPVSLPSWSPDGASIAYVGHEQGYMPGANMRLLVIPATGGTARDLTGDFDRSINNVAMGDVRMGVDGQCPVWSPDGQSLLTIATDSGNTGIYRAALSGGITRIIGGDRACVGFTTPRDGAPIAFAATDPTRPNEIFVANADGSGERQLTRHNDDFLAGLTIQPAERIAYTSTGGAAIEGWVIKPADFDPARQYPLMLKIHGGPHGTYGNAFSHEFQLLVAQGYVLLYVNPRGSQGYGQDFAHCIRADWGNLDYADIMAGVDHVVAQGYVDADRMAAGGASYGGYMTCWILGHTDRFKAVVTERVVSNFNSFWGTSDIGQTFGAWELGGKTPVEDPEVYRRCSPITYMHRATTPTLIIHGEMDLRCPMEQSEQAFIVLKRAGVPVDFVRYPDESHNHAVGGQPRHRTDRLTRILAFLNERLG